MTTPKRQACLWILCRFAFARLHSGKGSPIGIEMRKLFTIGYEGANLDDFVATLLGEKIDVLLDVREMPISRRRGYSKTALGQTVQIHGIGYRHERQLGSPKAIRHRLHEDGDFDRFFRDFWRHLDKQGALLETLARDIKGNVVLMCYEKDYTECHRRSVADALAALIGTTPIHLGVENHAGKASEKTRSYPRQSVSAA
jgi:uncharacterized protein (DUF488 family)